MPTYEFACLACDTDFEKNVPYEDVDKILCEVCGHRAKRVYSFTGIVWSPTRNNGHS
jgi:putative FmdB family regulatory protein